MNEQLRFPFLPPPTPVIEPIIVEWPLHYHSCPCCYEAKPCTMSCTIEPDLADGDRDFGSHAVCVEPGCVAEEARRQAAWRSYERRGRALRRLGDPGEEPDDRRS